MHKGLTSHAINISDMIWPSSSCACDLHLRSTVFVISISEAPSWSPSSLAWHHDLHHLDLYQRVVTWSSRQLLLLQLLLSHSDKVKQLYGASILCNKKTTIRLLPVADNFNKTWSSHTKIYIITSWPYHITTCPAKTRPTSSTLLLQVLRACYGL